MLSQKRLSVLLYQVSQRIKDV